MAIQFLMLLVTLSLLFAYAWPIALFCLLMLPVVYGIVKYFERDILLGQRSVMIAHARNESNYVDSIRGIHTIKVMNRENLFAGVARDIFSSFQGSVWQLGKVRIRFRLPAGDRYRSFSLHDHRMGGPRRMERHPSHRPDDRHPSTLAGLVMQTAIMVALTNLQQGAGVRGSPRPDV